MSQPDTLHTEVAPQIEGIVEDSRVPTGTESQWQLIRRRFRRHRLVMASLWVIAVLAFVAIFAEFLAPHDPHDVQARYTYAPPQRLHFIDRQADGGWSFRPYVFDYKVEVDAEALRREFTIDESEKIYVRFFTEGYDYELFGLIPMDTHFIGTERSRDPLFLLGSDRLGRDVLSRLIYGTRISLSVGLVGVILSLVLGVVIGGLAGFYGGLFDAAVQRVIEFLRSLPAIPLWMGLAAAMPPAWSPLQVYFAITIILSLRAGPSSREWSEAGSWH